jgi:putative Mn2+ efflux pump MntP
MARNLLPPVSQLKALTIEQTHAVVTLIDRENARSHSYATTGLICGTVSFLALIGSFTYLVTHGYYKSASSIFGAGVLTIISKMLAQRLAEK